MNKHEGYLLGKEEWEIDSGLWDVQGKQRVACIGGRVNRTVQIRIERLLSLR